jgi:Arc/MetJ-type ribon-helix-helix transcriptional regulator
MTRTSTTFALTARELRQLRKQIDAGTFKSTDDAIHQGLRLLLGQTRSSTQPHPRPSPSRLAAGYRACAEHDRQCARDWSKLDDAWPRE